MKPKPTEEAKQRAKNYMSLKGALEPKQETLEEAAEIGRFAEKKYLDKINNFESVDFKDGVFEGAKWQAERMYSEEEVYRKLHNLMTDIKLYGVVINDDIDLKKWFEQFKKK